MHKALATMIDRLDSPALAGTGVIPWGCPVPSFGDLVNSRVVSVGLNPSSREFLDESGEELQGKFRRFHTLGSLGLQSWSDSDASHLKLILDDCAGYFQGNPYDRWFRKLDWIIGGTQTSYYDLSNQASHIDLIPYATESKWTDLTSRQRSLLLTAAHDTLGNLLQNSSVQVLILNGASVVEHFQKIANVQLKKRVMPTWSLPRRGTPDVAGFAYKGQISSLPGMHLGRNILVLGYNHNLQGSFGVTSSVIRAIRRWIARTTKKSAQ